MSSKSTSNCGQTPSVVLTCFICANRSNPCYSPSPLVGMIRPVIIEIAVVFPAPLWPSNAKISFSNIFTFISFTAVNSPNFFLKFLILSSLPSDSIYLYFSPSSSKPSMIFEEFDSLSAISFASEAPLTKLDFFLLKLLAKLFFFMLSNSCSSWPITSFFQNSYLNGNKNP